MKNLIAAIGVVMMMAAGVASASQNREVLTRAPGDVFTPKGFDSNDNAQIILSGALSNVCFHEAPASFRVDQGSKRIYVTDQVYSFHQCQDAMMYIPYTQVVNLGALSPGIYEIWSADGKGGYAKRADLPVAHAVASPYSPDEVLYAPVSELQYLSVRTGDPSIVIKGVMSNSCLSPGPVSVSLVAGNVMQVEPTARWVKAAHCAAGAFPFSESVVLRGFPKRGDVLIHVRSMGGQAINRVISPLDRLAAGE